MNSLDRQEIAPLVIEIIRRAAGRHFDLEEGDHLFEDLRMGPPIRRALAKPFSRLSDEHGGQTISLDEAERLRTVGESIDLVFRRANGRD